MGPSDCLGAVGFYLQDCPLAGEEIWSLIACLVRISHCVFCVTHCELFSVFTCVWVRKAVLPECPLAGEKNNKYTDSLSCALFHTECLCHLL